MAFIIAKNPRTLFDEAMDGLPCLPEAHQRVTEEDGDEQHLQQVARRGERIGKGRGDDVHDGRACFGLTPTGRNLATALASSVAGSTLKPSRLEQMHHDHGDHQRQRRHDLEVDQRLAADAADFLHVAGARDAEHDGAEDPG